MINPNLRKIIFLGLDNAGKSSIVKNLKGEINLTDYFGLEPTLNQNIETTDIGSIKVSLWDLGGQSEIRRENIQQVGEILSGVDKIFFVIDIQDRNRYKEALEYFGFFLDYLNDKGLNPEILLFLHKYDKGLEHKAIFSNEILFNNVINPIKDKIPKNSKFNIFKSSLSVKMEKIEY